MIVVPPILRKKQFNFYLIVIACLSGINLAFVPQLRGSIKTEHPGFVALYCNTSETRPEAKWNIVVSRFKGVPFSRDYVSLIRAPGVQMGDLEKLTVEDLSSSLHWPNEVKAIPEEVFGRGNMIIAPTGFLVPTKGAGALEIFDLNEAAKMGPFTPEPAGTDGDWFYHRAVWLDMDGDGKLDIVTCRASKPLIGSVKGQLLWFKNPDFDMPWTVGWQSEILYEHENPPDVFLIEAKLKAGNETIQTLITAGYFSKTLDIWWRTGEDKPWTYDYGRLHDMVHLVCTRPEVTTQTDRRVVLSGQIQHKVIDNTEGAAFDLLISDLDGDGTNELAVTYNKEKNGTMIVYEIPEDFRTDKFNKHLLVDGIDSAVKFVGKGAPGSFQLVFPTTRNHTGSPDILLSGDDSGVLYLLKHTGIKWKYLKLSILDESPGTVGEIDTGDIDGDGYTDIIVPCYSSGKIKILSYQP